MLGCSTSKKRASLRVSQLLKQPLLMLVMAFSFVIQKRKLLNGSFVYDPFESGDDVLFAHGKHIWT